MAQASTRASYRHYLKYSIPLIWGAFLVLLSKILVLQTNVCYNIKEYQYIAKDVQYEQH
jgi:hypothetical protein